MIRVPRDYPEVIAFYGDPKFDPRRGSIDATWERANMVMIHALAPCVPRLYVHRLIVEPLQRAMATSLMTGWEPRTMGCFSPRLKRGSKSPQVSLHTFGIAIDIDADANRLIVDCPPSDARRFTPGARTIPDEVVTAFAAEGFAWGGAFLSRFDPMHFQLARGC